MKTVQDFNNKNILTNILLVLFSVKKYPVKHNEKHECSSISIPFLNDRKKETSAKLHLPVISYSYTNTIGSSVDSVLIANIFHTSSKIIPPFSCMK